MRRHGDALGNLNTWAALEAVVCAECPDCAGCLSEFLDDDEGCALGHTLCTCDRGDRP